MRTYLQYLLYYFHYCILSILFYICLFIYSVVITRSLFSYCLPMCVFDVSTLIVCLFTMFIVAAYSLVTYVFYLSHFLFYRYFVHPVLILSTYIYISLQLDYNYYLRCIVYTGIQHASAHDASPLAYGIDTRLSVALLLLCLYISFITFLSRSFTLMKILLNRNVSSSTAHNSMEHDGCEQDGWRTQRGRGKASRVATTYQREPTDQGAFLEARSWQQPGGHRGQVHRHTDHGGRDAPYFHPRGASGFRRRGGRGPRTYHGGRGQQGGRGGQGHTQGGRGGQGPNLEGSNDPAPYQEGPTQGGRGGQRGRGNASNRQYNSNSKPYVDVSQSAMMSLLLSLQATVVALGRKIGFNSEQPAPPANSPVVLDPPSREVRDTGVHWGPAPAANRTNADQPRGGHPQGNSYPQGGNNPLRPGYPKRNNQARTDTRTQQEQSTNPDFTKVCKAAYRYVQITHHGNNWAALPKGIASSLDRIVGNIRPPMPSDELTNGLAALTLEFGQKICKTVQDHMSAGKIKIEQELMSLSGLDKDTARVIVDKQLNTKLGKKMSDSHRSSILAEAFAMVGIAKSTSSTDPLVQTPLKPKGSTQPKPSVVKKLFTQAVTGTPSKKRRVASDDDMSPEIPLSGTGRTTPQAAADQRPRPGPLSARKSPINRTHNKGDYDGYHFDVRGGCRILILGDSQVQNLTGLPDYFQIESFRGAKFPWMTDIVKDMELPDSVEHIVLAAGFNHRDDNVQSQVEPAFNTCLESLRGKGREIHFLAIDTPQTLSEQQQQVFSDINELARHKLKNANFIRESDRYAGTIADGLHYNRVTLVDIAKRIQDHFNNLN